MGVGGVMACEVALEGVGEGCGEGGGDYGHVTGREACDEPVDDVNEGDVTKGVDVGGEGGCGDKLTVGDVVELGLNAAGGDEVGDVFKHNYEF